jgi:hypothetical protein
MANSIYEYGCPCQWCTGSKEVSDPPITKVKKATKTKPKN